MKIDVAALMKVIHRKCLDCCGGMRTEVTKCQLKDCPLHPYRTTQN